MWDPLNLLRVSVEVGPLTGFWKAVLEALPVKYTKSDTLRGPDRDATYSLSLGLPLGPMASNLNTGPVLYIFVGWE